MTRVALIDDHESVRLGLEAACLRSGDQDVVFSGSNVREYLAWRGGSSAGLASAVGGRPAARTNPFNPWACIFSGLGGGRWRDVA